MRDFWQTGARRFLSLVVEVLNRVQDDRGCAGGGSLFVFEGEPGVKRRAKCEIAASLRSSQ